MKQLKIFAVMLVALTISVSAQVKTFVASGDSRNQATFESNAPLEDIIGVSDDLTAVAMIDLNNLANSKGKVKINLNKLRTGIDLRDKHVRSEMWLNTSKYPYAIFELKSITPLSSNKLANGKAVKVNFNGVFTVHGVSHKISAPGELAYFMESPQTKTKMPGNLLRVKTNFKIKLSDYGVKIPSMVVAKLDDNIKISASFIASDANTGSMENPCNMKSHKMKANGMKNNMKANSGGMGAAKNNKANPCGM